MKISCLLPSHDKPEYIHLAIDGVLAQKHQDWELIVMDSGVLYDADYFVRWKDSRIKVIRTGETEEMKSSTAMAPWCFNECFRRNLASGDLITYHCDDDVLYPNAFSVFNKWATNNPELNAFYASIDLVFYADGQEPLIYSEIKALEIGGEKAYRMDCRVDSLQLCHRFSLLREVEERFGSCWPEEIETCRHADGVFMERIGRICSIYPIPEKIGQNRRTPKSTYYKHT